MAEATSPATGRPLRCRARLPRLGSGEVLVLRRGTRFREAVAATGIVLERRAPGA